MNAPIWIIAYPPWGGQLVIVCNSEFEAERTIYHNTYYGWRCLKLTIKAWRAYDPYSAVGTQ